MKKALSDRGFFFFDRILTADLIYAQLVQVFRLGLIQLKIS
jgi:hypothetical protein